MKKIIKYLLNNMKKYVFLRLYVWYRNDIYKHYTEQSPQIRFFVKKIINSEFFDEERRAFCVK